MIYITDLFRVAVEIVMDTGLTCVCRNVERNNSPLPRSLFCRSTYGKQIFVALLILWFLVFVLNFKIILLSPFSFLRFVLYAWNMTASTWFHLFEIWIHVFRFVSSRFMNVPIIFIRNFVKTDWHTEAYFYLLGELRVYLVLFT